MNVKTNKFFKGSITEFNEWLCKLKNTSSAIEENKKKYEEIENSVVYISENFGIDPQKYIDSSISFEGAVYAHGAIIRSDVGEINWADTSTDIDFDPSTRP